MSDDGVRTARRRADASRPPIPDRIRVAAVSPGKFSAMTDRPNHADDALPARRSPATPAAPSFDPSLDDHGDLSSPGPPPKRLSLRLAARAMRRYWWQALLLWSVLSVGLVYLAATKVKPSFDAVALVRVEMDDSTVFTQNNNAPVDIDAYLENQVSRMTSSTVLGATLSEHPELNRLPFLKDSPDPEGTVRETLRVGVRPKTTLIQVDMSSAIPTEAAEVVNAVVSSYLKLAQATYDATTQRRIEQFVKARDEQSLEVKKQREIVENLHKSIGAASVETVKDRSVATLDKYKQWSDQLTGVEIAVIAERARSTSSERRRRCRRDGSTPGRSTTSSTTRSTPTPASTRSRPSSTGASRV